MEHLNIPQPWWIDMVKVCHKSDHVCQILTLPHCFEHSNPVGQKSKNTPYISIIYHMRELQVKQPMLLVKRNILEDHVTFCIKFFSLLIEVLPRRYLLTMASDSSMIKLMSCDCLNSLKSKS